jgi:hypothetical protein
MDDVNVMEIRRESRAREKELLGGRRFSKPDTWRCARDRSQRVGG